MKINKETQLCISIASSPGNFGATIHNEAFRSSGLNYCYIPFKTTDLQGAIRGIRALGIRGCGVSMPHKISVIDFLDEIEQDAQTVGAVNTIVNTNKVLKGWNTDVYGVRKALAYYSIPNNVKILVVGAGGICNAILFALQKHGIKHIYVSNRTFEKAQTVASKFNVECIPFKDMKFINPEFIINATSVGMNTNACIFPESIIKQSEYVMDVPTNPMKTTLIKLAESYKKRAIPGYFISLYQAARQFELYTEHAAPLEIMKKTMNKLLTF